MPDISLHDAALLAVLAVTLIALMYVGHRMDCRAQRRIEDAERREAADRLSRMLALRRAYNLDNLPPKAPAHSPHLAPGVRPHPLRTRAFDPEGPWIIPPASMSEPARMKSINTTDTPDGDAYAPATVTTYSPEN